MEQYNHIDQIKQQQNSFTSNDTSIANSFNKNLGSKSFIDEIRQKYRNQCEIVKEQANSIQFKTKINNDMQIFEESHQKIEQMKQSSQEQDIYSLIKQYSKKFKISINQQEVNKFQQGYNLLEKNKQTQNHQQSQIQKLQSLVSSQQQIITQLSQSKQLIEEKLKNLRCDQFNFESIIESLNIKFRQKQHQQPIINDTFQKSQQKIFNFKIQKIQQQNNEQIIQYQKQNEILIQGIQFFYQMMNQIQIQIPNQKIQDMLQQFQPRINEIYNTYINQDNYKDITSIYKRDQQIINSFNECLQILSLSQNTNNNINHIALLGCQADALESLLNQRDYLKKQT